MLTSEIEASLAKLGLTNLENIYWNLPSPKLYEQAIRRREAILSHRGPLVVRTGYFTGRAAQDKYFVDEPSSRDKLWWGKVNFPFDEARFDSLLKRVQLYLASKDVFVQDCYAGADRNYELPVRIITQDAWHALFARTMFIRPADTDREIEVEEPQFTVIHAPHYHALPSKNGTNSEAFVMLHMGRRLVLIGGTSYAGEIKKSIFTVMNYLLPQQNVMSMHAAANVDSNDKVAVFFGLSGTGKTTLSADPDRRLIGDDEHGWSDNGVFNIEGGCYAKTIRVTDESEPVIYEMTERFGTILENVCLDNKTRHLDLFDDTMTENTRAAYPVTHVPGAIYPGIAGHPGDIVMLTADAFGVLPPIARLTAEQAMYHFISGYTSKVAGTEAGLKEPEATFSTCFGAPFMPLHPSVYARLLGEKIRKHKVRCWLLNTGWTGGPYGVGERMKLSHTRRMLNAALGGELDEVSYRRDRIFGLHIPEVCPDIPTEVLDPASTWPNRSAYEEKARELAARFQENFKEYAEEVGQDIINAGPAAAAA